MTEKKVVEVKTREYTREVQPREVTFICDIHDGGPTEVTEMLYPGPPRHVCTECKRSGRYAAWRSAKRHGKEFS